MGLTFQLDILLLDLLCRVHHLHVDAEGGLADLLLGLFLLEIAFEVVDPPLRPLFEFRVSRQLLADHRLDIGRPVLFDDRQPGPDNGFREGAVPALNFPDDHIQRLRNGIHVYRRLFEILQQLLLDGGAGIFIRFVTGYSQAEEVDDEAVGCLPGDRAIVLDKSVHLAVDGESLSVVAHLNIRKTHFAVDDINNIERLPVISALFDVGKGRPVALDGPLEVIEPVIFEAEVEVHLGQQLGILLPGGIGA